jgi:hypothetical protein
LNGSDDLQTSDGGCSSMTLPTRWTRPHEDR